MRRLIMASAVLAFAFACQRTPRTSPGDLPPVADLVIVDASLVNVVTGDLEPDRAVVIANGYIRAIVASDDAPPARTIYQASGQYLIPGLWDMHVHISDRSFFPLFVENGIVGVRDMGGALAAATDGCGSIRSDILMSWREEIRSGTLIGPEIVMAGTVLSARPSPTSRMVTTPEEGREAVIEAAATGSDFIKVYEDIQPDVFSEIMAAANQHNLFVAGHVSEETLTIMDALDVGQRSIEHVRAPLLLCFAETDAEREQLFTSDNWTAEDRQWAAPHVTLCPRIWEILRQDQTWLTPTLAVQETLVSGADPGFESDPRRASLPQSIREAVAARSAAQRALDPAVIAERENWNRYIDRLVARAVREDASLLAGSDAACEGVIPGYGLHRELQLLVAAGLTPLQALRSATLEPARYFEREHSMGQVQTGFQADLVLLNANPLVDIAATTQIDMVIIDGKIAYQKDVN